MHTKMKASAYDRYTADLLYGLSVKTCALMFGKHVTSVQRAIDTGALFAQKLDAAPGTKGGMWLISYTSAVDLWGQPIAHIESEYNHVEFRR